MNEPEPVRIDNHDDLLAAIPHLLGHVPDRSLVAIGLTGTQVTCHARVDLPRHVTAAHHPTPVTVQLRNTGCDGAILIAYGPSDIASACLEHTAADLTECGLAVTSLIRVTDGAYHRLDAPLADRASGGTSVPLSSAVATQLAVHGATARASRADITALLDPAPDADRAAVTIAIDTALTASGDLDWAGQRAADLHAVTRWLAASSLPGPDGIAALALAVVDLDVRDHVLTGAESYLAEGDWPVDLWLWVTRHVEDGLLSPCASILACFAYKRGHAVLAVEALRKALEAAPHYRLANLLMEAIQAGIPPAKFPVRPADTVPRP